jgi:hypothetical protein
MAEENEERLKAVGPIDPENGFPLWFDDGKGVRLELGLNRDPLNPDPLIPAIGDLKTPGDPLKFPDNFPDESFYFMAEAELDVGGNAAGVVGRARVILALEAAFGGAGDPKPGLNVVFARIRVRMDDLIPGAEYTVTHPYGKTDPLEADDRGRVFYTEDLGIVEGDPTAVLRSGRVAPFLVGTSSVPDGYIGDGVTEQQVTGSPFNTNFVIIEGPRVNPNPNDPNPDRVSTDRFTVQGRKAKRLGARVDGATYAKSGNDYLLTVHASSVADRDLRLVGTGVHFQLDGEGEFYTGFGRVTNLPTDARLVNVRDLPPTSFPVTFIDRVIVESAIFDRDNRTLTIKARSSDPNAVLTLSQLNLTLTSNPQSFSRVAVPSKIIIKSSLGGEGQQRVEVTGTPVGNLPVKAIVAPPPAAFAEELVTLDGSGSLGATSFTWSQTAGPFVTLNGVNAAKVTFTPTAAGDYTLNLTVQGSDGNSNNTDIPVTVQPKPEPDVLEITRQDYRTATRQFRIDGTVNADRVPKLPNVVAVEFLDGKKEQAIPDINGDWSVRRVLLASEVGLAPRPGIQDTVEVSSKRSNGSVQVTLRIRN